MCQRLDTSSIIKWKWNIYTHFFQTYRKLEKLEEFGSRSEKCRLKQNISLFVLFPSLVLHLPTCATNFISTWILSTFCWPLKEIAYTLWHELAPDWLILLHTWEFMFKRVPDFSSLLLFYSFLHRCLCLVFSASFALVTHLSAGHQASPFVWQTGASSVWWSNLPQMCKTWLIGEMSSKVVENTRALRMEKGGPFPFITSTDRWSRSQFSFSIFLYYVPQLINALHPLQVDLFSTWSRCLLPHENKQPVHLKTSDQP